MAWQVNRHRGQKRWDYAGTASRQLPPHLGPHEQVGRCPVSACLAMDCNQALHLLCLSVANMGLSKPAAGSAAVSCEVGLACRLVVPYARLKQPVLPCRMPQTGPLPEHMQGGQLGDRCRGGGNANQRHIKTEQKRRDRINDGCAGCHSCSSCGRNQAFLGQIRSDSVFAGSSPCRTFCPQGTKWKRLLCWARQLTTFAPFRYTVQGTRLCVQQLHHAGCSTAA